MVRIVFSIILIFLVSSCSSKKEKNSEETAKIFIAYTLYEANKEMFEFLTPYSQKVLKTLSEKNKELKLKPKDFFIIKPLSKDMWLGKLKSKIIKEENGMVYVELTSETEKTNKLIIKVKKISGIWKIALFEK
jgi:hypothetical protein